MQERSEEMKRFIPILFFTFAIFLLSACNRTNTNTSSTGRTTTHSSGTTTHSSTTDQGTTTLKDGTYTIEGDPWEEGHEWVEIKVKDGKITDVDFKRFDPEGKEIEINEGHELHDIRMNLKNRIMESQTVDDLEDLIENATTTTTNWLKGIRDAFKDAQTGTTRNNK